eukprot:jgi/Chrzof1/5725/Cz16g13060.t1
MAAPFTDLTNECAKHRTPSPNAPPAPRFNRQHSPWTAARTKKKTRSVAPVAMLSEDLPGSTSCHSPDVTSKSAFLGDDDTLIGQFGAFSVQTPSPAATSKTSSSSHSSPALDRNDQAELHPAKAYIVHMQDASTNEPQLRSGRSSSRSSSSTSPGERSTVWFQQSEQVALGHTNDKHTLVHSQSPPFALPSTQDPHSGVPVAGHHTSNIHTSKQVPVGRRHARARRRSWAADGHKRTMPGCQRAEQPVLHTQSVPTMDCSVGAADIIHAGTSCLSFEDRLQQAQHPQPLHESPTAQLKQSLSDGQQRGGHMQLDHVVGLPEPRNPHVQDLTVDSLQWFEREMSLAADAADPSTAEQVWADMRLKRVRPSLDLMHSFLLCFYHGGGNPNDAQQAVREMCTAAGMDPDAFTSHYLAAIDMSWQQLQCNTLC